MDMESILREAVSVVNRAEVPEALRGGAFEAVLAAMLEIGGTSVGRAEEGLRRGGGARGGESGSVVAQIGIRCGLDVARVKEVYDEDSEQGLVLVVPVGKLESSKASAAKQIALLMAGGRQLGGLEEWTDVRGIRSMCEHYGKFDTANFATTVKKLQDEFSFKGSGQQRQVRINQVGVERLKTLLGELVGGTS